MAIIELPELGEGITTVEISDVMVQVGDTINIDDSLILVETEKASMEIPATKCGTVHKVHVVKGKSISPGDGIVTVTQSGENNESNKQGAPEDEFQGIENDIKQTLTEPRKENKAPIAPHFSEQNTTSSMGKPVLASPSVRLFSRELGCNLNLIQGTGVKGRITKEDVQNYIKAQLTDRRKPTDSIIDTAPGQNTDFSKYGDIDIQPLNKIKRITGERLQQAWKAIPHVTQFDKCDITKLDKLRLHIKKINKDDTVKVSLIPFFIKAVCIILKEMPHFNSSLDGSNKNLILKKFINVGVAVDTPSGLVVPVIKDADLKSIKDLARDLENISSKSRERKILPSEMEGGCFTISSLGGIGGTNFTPIINPPEVAILGISRSSDEPVFIDGKFRRRLILPISLSYDHRVIDGADATRFTTRFGKILSNLEEISTTI